MNGEPTEAKATRTSFVYDTRTGKVVHIHQFVPYGDGTISDQEMEEAALQLAPRAWDRARLAVLHHGERESRELSPGNHYRVDLENSRLVVESPAEGPTQGETR